MDEIYIPPDSQKLLLQLSRQILESFVRGTEKQVEKINDPHLLITQYGAFVSLHKGQDLRGCIGTCFPTRPLYEIIIEMTEAAASRDQRVYSIQQSELPDIHIDISILSPLQLANDPLSLEVGKHGLFISSGEKRGVLLPQVAIQYGWDMETFLCQTCLKAGLSKDTWKERETKVSCFSALIIEEER
ncbi:MAG: AmmeMemoRadiSam system protein A [Candidatus Binatia bacterium]